MREVIEAALAIVAASAILWAVGPGRGEVHYSAGQLITAGDVEQSGAGSRACQLFGNSE